MADSNKNKLRPVIIGLSFIAAIVIFVWGYNFLKSKNLFKAETVYYASYEKPIEYPPLSEAAKQRISQFFAKQFLMGQWRLNQIKYSTNAIQVYVQTPTAIALEGEALSQYLHYALCPSPSKRIWQDIQARELSVYVFSHSIRKGERTLCN